MPADGVVALRQTALPVREQVGRPSLRNSASNPRSSSQGSRSLPGLAFRSLSKDSQSSTGTSPEKAGRPSFSSVALSANAGLQLARSSRGSLRPPSPAGNSAKMDQVSDLALEAMGLGDEYIEAALRQYRGMTSLHLGFNGLTENCMRVVGDQIASMRDLAYLDLWGNHIGGYGTAMLFRPIPGRRWTLRILNLSQCGLGAGAIRHLVKYAGQAPLRALALSGNPLGPDGAPQLAELLKTVIAADFSDCALGVIGARHFGKALASSMTTCELLGLSWNNFGPNGIRQVLAGTRRHVKLQGSLEALFLRGNGLLTEAGAKEVYGCVARPNREGLKHLDLARNAATHSVLRQLEALPIDCIFRIRKPTIPIQDPNSDGDSSPIADIAAYAADEDDGVFWRHIQVVGDLAAISADWRQKEVVCPKNHQLEKSSSTAAALCSVCCLGTIVEGKSYVCRWCNFYICERCHKEKSVAWEPKTLLRTQSEGSLVPRGSAVRATTAPQQPVTRLDACRIPDSIPLRNRRNEVEAFEAFVFDRWRAGVI